MISVLRKITNGLVIYFSVSLLAGCSFLTKDNTSGQQEDYVKPVPTGILTITGKSFALILSKAWGTGILEFKGKKYNIKARTFGLGYSLGHKKVNMKAVVYNLYQLNDIAGNYYGIEAGVTLGKGRYVANIGNSKGVTLGLLIKSKGIAIDYGAGLSTLRIKFISKQAVK